MANFYKSDTYSLTTTNLTTILTINVSSIAIVKSVQASHATASNVDVDLYVKKSGGSDVEIAHTELNKSSENMVKGILNLEAGDVLKMQADAANEITGQVSYLLIDRSQENG
jgi:flagellar motor switch protein FliM